MKMTAKTTGSCLLILVVMLSMTQPQKLPSAVLIIPFVLLFVVLALTIAMAIGWRHGSVTAKHIRTGCVGAILPILLLVMQSIGQLTLRDALTLFTLFAITYFYMAKVNNVNA